MFLNTPQDVDTFALLTFQTENPILTHCKKYSFNIDIENVELLGFARFSKVDEKALATNTHGVNNVNFAILDLFGYQLAPR